MDAIVRPQLTITQYLYYISYKDIGCCLYATGKVLEKFREWVSGPPLLEPFPVLPPPLYTARISAGAPVLRRRAQGEGVEVWCDYNVYIIDGAFIL